MEYIIALLSDPVAWAALATLVVMEIVLGVDNLVFIAIVTNRLPEEQRPRARRLGIGAALLLRVMLLGTVAFIVGLSEPVIEIAALSLSWRDLILIAGGLFLVWKATREIHHLVDPDPAPTIYRPPEGHPAFGSVVAQILVLDLDSIITAVGMTPHVPIMVVAVLAAVAAMLLAADPLARFIQKNPTIVMLALGFLLLIGTALIADGFGVHIPRGYIYAAMAFSALIETLNMLARKAKRRTAAARQEPPPTT